MKKLRVLVSFRDESNFFLLHKVGDEITVSDDRAARLVKGGICEEVVPPIAQPVAEPAEQVEEKAPSQPTKRQYRKRKSE